MPFIILRSLRTGLHAIWAKGNWDALPGTGFVIAANHHSWWDVYLVFLLAKQLNRNLSAMMDDEQLATFRFFRNLGGVGRKEVREAIRRLKRGNMFVILPEGNLQQNGEVKALKKGVMFLAKASKTDIYPLAVRVVMRGAQHPEAFFLLGEKLELSGDETEDLRVLKDALNDLLQDIDETLETTNPEEQPIGFERWLSGRASVSERTDWLKRLWL